MAHFLIPIDPTKPLPYPFTMPGAAPWTAEQAREMARRSHLPGSARFRKPTANPQENPQPAPGSDYDTRRLHRVRVQLDQLDAAITRETAKHQPDGQRLNWLAQAQDRLSEQERILAGRPLPGSRRPKDQAPSNQAPTAQMVDEEQVHPAPAPSPSTSPIVYRQPAEHPAPDPPSI